jgi:hypothetical protein
MPVYLAHRQVRLPRAKALGLYLLRDGLIYLSTTLLQHLVMPRWACIGFFV